MTCIAICGDSASGKSRLANWLAFILYGPNVVLLECDRYHKWERADPHWKQYTQLNPEANDLSLLEQDIRDLKAGKTVYRRQYDHETGTFTVPQRILPESNLVVCGLHTLMCDPSLFDITIFLDPAQALKEQWKLKRDVEDRGYTAEQVLAQIERRKPDYKQYIEPLKDKADVVISRYETEGHLCSTIHLQRNIGEDLQAVLKEIL